MDDNNRNTILAIALSILVLIGWNYLYISPKMEEERRAAEVLAERQAAEATSGQSEDSQAIPQAGTNAEAPASTESSSFQSREAALSSNPRVEINSDLLSGSINLKGARFDDLKLNQYRETIDDSSPLIELLKPGGTENAYFAEFGYTPNNALGTLPGPSTIWSTSSNTLTGDGSVTLDWTNEKGIEFKRTISLDDHYMFKITDEVRNTLNEEIKITPYGRISRFGTPKTEGIFVLHEGLIGVFGEEGLQEIDYGDVEDAKQIEASRTEEGWLGITDKYWATALIPGKSFKPRFAFFDNGIA